MEIKEQALSAAADRYSQIAGLQLALVADVDAARAAKATWAEVGRALGISPQAAHKRFAPRARGDEG